MSYCLLDLRKFLLTFSYIFICCLYFRLMVYEIVDAMKILCWKIYAEIFIADLEPLIIHFMLYDQMQQMQFLLSANSGRIVENWRKISFLLCKFIFPLRKSCCSWNRIWTTLSFLNNSVGRLESLKFQPEKSELDVYQGNSADSNFHSITIQKLSRSRESVHKACSLQPPMHKR